MELEGQRRVPHLDRQATSGSTGRRKRKAALEWKKDEGKETAKVKGVGLFASKPNFKNYVGDWRNGSGVKHLLFFQRTLVQFSAPTSVAHACL